MFVSTRSYFTGSSVHTIMLLLLVTEELREERVPPMAVELPRNTATILKPLGGMSHTDDVMLLGIHSTKWL